MLLKVFQESFKPYSALFFVFFITLIFWYEHFPDSVADSLPRLTRQMEYLPAFGLRRVLILYPVYYPKSGL